MSQNKLTLSNSETAFIKGRTICRLATITQDGWPHCVPVGYVFKDGLFYIPSAKRSGKVANLTGNRRACLVIDDELDQKGFMIQGWVKIALGRRFARLRKWMMSETGWTIGTSNGAILVVTPVKKATWALKN